MDHSGKPRRRAIVSICVTLLVGASASACERGSVRPTIVVVEGRFEARDDDGGRLPASALIGEELTIRSQSGSRVRLRIDAVLSEQGPVGLYALSRFDAEASEWVPHCQRGPDGLAAAVPLAGRWNPAGTTFSEDHEEFTVTCTAGANGKCARMGYVPGTSSASGESLTPYFVACVRMMRADYCGDGRSHTKAGTPVDLVDRLGRQGTWYDSSKRFEAAWGPNGAVCVARTRAPDQTSLEQLREQCPSSIEAIDNCDEQRLDRDPRVLLVNRS